MDIWNPFSQIFAYIDFLSGTTQNKSTPRDYKSRIYKCTSYFLLAFISLGLKLSISYSVDLKFIISYLGHYLSPRHFEFYLNFHVSTLIISVRFCFHKEFKIFILIKKQDKIMAHNFDICLYHNTDSQNTRFPEHCSLIIV